MIRSRHVAARRRRRGNRCLHVTAVLLLLAAGSVATLSDANAQLRGLGGGVGGVGGIGGGGVPNIGVPGGGVGGLGGAMPGDIGAPSGATDRIGTGINIPIENGPSLPRPPVNAVTNTLNGAVTNTSSTALGATNRLGNSVTQLPRNAAATPGRRSGVPAAGERRYVPNELVVSLPATLNPQAREALFRQHGLTTLDSHSLALTGTTFYRLRIGDQRSVSEVIRALEADAGVRTAQPNYRFTLAQQAPIADPAIRPEALQYAVEKLKLPQAHRLATGGQVLVAVIDSGIDTSHPEIAGNIAGSFDALVSQDTAHAHGTAMAGAIVAHAKLTGVAPSARLLAIRAFGATPAGAESTTLVLLKAIDWAVAHGARVINMSFAGPTDPEIARALAQARKKGIVLVAAAGNAGPKSPPLFPASDTNVVAVTAIGSDDKLLAAANRGKHIAIAAPGVDILAPAPQATYQLTSGTSIAAAHVSGLVALILERKPDLRPDAVRKLLLSTAIDLGPKGRDDQFGAGLADAHRALLSLTTTAGEPGRATTAAAR